MTVPAIEAPETLLALNSIASRLTQLGIIVPAFDISMLSSLASLLSTSPLSVLEVRAAGRLYPHKRSTYDPFNTVRDFHWLPENVAPHLSLRKLRLSNFCLCDADEHTRRRLFPLIQCRTMKEAFFTCPTFLDILIKWHVQLSALTLELDSRYETADPSCPGPPSPAGIRDFLLSQMRLESLSIINGTDVVQSGQVAFSKELLGHLGNSLRSLKIHEREAGSHMITSERIILPPSSIQIIGEVCPHLRTLAIDVPSEDSLVSS